LSYLRSGEAEHLRMIHSRWNSSTWRDHLQSYRVSKCALFDSSFIERWGDEPWAPNEADRKAAGELHTQIASRITTQRLDYLDGVEKAALDSVHSLFGKTREVVDKNFPCRHFDALAWHVLNTRVRPFTAKWHRESESGALTAVDATDEFRAELSALQPVLRLFDELLLHLRDGKKPPSRGGRAKSDREERLERELAVPLGWGIHERLGALDKSAAAKLNLAERLAIVARRTHYHLHHNPHAVALASLRRRHPLGHVRAWCACHACPAWHPHSDRLSVYGFGRWLSGMTKGLTVGGDQRNRTRGLAASWYYNHYR
jgi:hypothetical protein